MANFFRSLFTDRSSCSLLALTTLPLISDLPLLENISLPPEEVLQELKCLKTSKSIGPDGLPARILVEFTYEINSLCELFTMSLFTDKFISEWKDANLSPAFKNSSRAQLDS